MIAVGELFARTWASYTKRVLPLLGLYLIAVVVTFAAAGIFLGMGGALAFALESMRKGIAIGAGVVASVAGLIAFGWGYGAFIFAATDDTMGFGEALKRSWQRVGAFIWVVVLYVVITKGGFGLFVVPGILFWVWFHFAFFVFAIEGASGMEAFLRSKEYVRGNFWGVFLRLFIAWIISVGILFVPVISSILSLLYAPFMVLFIYKMYADLRARKGEVACPAGGMQRALYPALGLVGFMAALITLIVLGVTAFLTSFALNMQMQLPIGP
jgi:hypothetical protein